MASITLVTRKDGGRSYKIRVRSGRDHQTHCMHWEVPEGWSQKTIDREVRKAAAEFENKVKEGQAKTRKQKQEEARREAEEAARIKTLQQYGDAVFLPALSVTCSENTRANYQQQLNAHIYPELGSFKLSEITPAQISAYLLKQQRYGYSWATCVKQYQILNQLFKRAFFEDLILKNPMDKVSRPKHPKDESAEQESKFYTAEEISYIQKCLNNEPLQWRVMVNLYITTGARRGEITGLKWSDINMKAGEIRINRTLCYTQQKGIYVNTPKGGKSRSVYPPKYVFDLLMLLKLEQYRENKIMKINSPLNGFVFRQQGMNTPIHPQTPTWYFSKFGKKYDIKDFHPHKLRHSFASIAITQGADIASVSEILGHADKSVTLRMYTHADAESKKRASNIFENAIAVR